MSQEFPNQINTISEEENLKLVQTMRRNGINQDISLNDINPVHYYERVEAKKKKVLSTLPEKLVVPFKEKEKTKKKLAKWKRNDPLRKIL